MKKLLYLTCMLAALALSSCEDKAPEPPKITNSFSFNGKTFEVRSAKADNLGPYFTHSELRFYFTDGTFLEGAGGTVVNGTYKLYFTLWSPGTEQFRTGTFPYDFAGSGNPLDHPEKNFMRLTYLVFDGNGDGRIDQADEAFEVDDAEGKLYWADNGTVTVKGTQPDYTLFFDLRLGNNHSDVRNTLKGNFSGVHHYDSIVD